MHIDIYIYAYIIWHIYIYMCKYLCVYFLNIIYIYIYGFFLYDDVHIHQSMGICTHFESTMTWLASRFVRSWFSSAFLQPCTQWPRSWWSAVGMGFLRRFTQIHCWFTRNLLGDSRRFWQISLVIWRSELENRHFFTSVNHHFFI